MISKREVLVRMGELITLDEVLADIEKFVLRAASEGKHSVTYKFPERADKLIKDQVYMKLAELGYSTNEREKGFRSSTTFDPYACITVGWKQ